MTNEATPPKDYTVREMSEEHKIALGLSWRETVYVMVSPDVDALLDVRTTVEATIRGEMRLRIQEGKVVGLVLEPYEGDAGYFGPRTTPNGIPERLGGDIPNAAYDMAVECIEGGFMFPDAQPFPSWVEWVA